MGLFLASMYNLFTYKEMIIKKSDWIINIDKIPLITPAHPTTWIRSNNAKYKMYRIAIELRSKIIKLKNIKYFSIIFE